MSERGLMPRYRHWRARRAMRRARKVMNAADKMMRDAHMLRPERRRFWGDVRAGRVDASKVADRLEATDD